MNPIFNNFDRLRELADNQSQSMSRRSALGTLPDYTRICWRNVDNNSEKCDVDVTWTNHYSFKDATKTMTELFPFAKIFSGYRTGGETGVVHNELYVDLTKQ